jgi:predicted ATPase/DNA-binding XRE family transcriptional regulator
MPAASFGQWVKQRRKNLDLTQEELALRISCSMALIQKIEAGERRPSRQTAELLAEHLAVSIDERPEFIRFAREKSPALQTIQEASWRALRRRFTNLPAQSTPLFGREQAVEKIKQQLLSKQARLLTLVGPPGVGKTRLGLEVAASLVNDYEDGVFLVSLAAVSAPELAVSSLARTFNLVETSRQAPLQRVKDFLADKRLLLLLDNLEQVVTVAPILADLLASCPWIQILATSRVSLHIRAERQHRVLPLQIPPLDPHLDLASLLQYPSIALFLDRAQAIDPDFELTPGNAAAIAEICTRLDGLPLAIELVAAQINRMPPRVMLAKLQQRLALLTGGPQDLPARRRSLRDAIGWSYELLEPYEQRIFARLAVFIGGCTLETARFVCGNDPPDLLAGALNHLANHNLIVHQEPEEGEREASRSEASLQNINRYFTNESRFAMLETIREYALELLEQSGEADEVRRGHADCFLDLVERADPSQHTWLDRLDSEHDNLGGALRSTLDRGDAEKALRMGYASWRFWQYHGHLREGLAWLNEALGLEASRSDPALVEARAKALLAAGWLRRDFGDWALMKIYFEDSLALYGSIEDPSGQAYALYSAGYANFLVGNAMPGIRMMEKSLTIYRNVGDKRGTALALMMLGRIAVGQGEYQKAEDNLAECLKLVQEMESNYGYAMTIGNLGELALYRGDYQKASGLLEQSIALLNQLGEKQICAWTMTKLAELAWMQEDFSQAHALLDESLALAREFGYRMNEAYSLIYLGLVMLYEGEMERAQSTCGAGLALFQEFQSEGEIAQAKKNLARVILRRGDYAHAARLYWDCLSVFKKRGYKPDIAECLEGLAAASCAEGNLHQAVRYAGAAYGLRDRLGFPLPPVLLDSFEELVKDLREGVGEDTFTALWKQGRDEGWD